MKGRGVQAQERGSSPRSRSHRALKPLRATDPDGRALHVTLTERDPSA